MRNLEARVPAKTDINLCVIDNNFGKNSHSNQLVGKKLSSGDIQGNADINFSGNELTYYIYNGGGVVDLFDNLAVCLQDYSSEFEHYPHMYVEEYNGRMAGHIPAYDDIQFNDEAYIGGIVTAVIPM